MVKLRDIRHNIRAWDESKHPRDRRGRFAQKAMGFVPRKHILGFGKKGGPGPDEVYKDRPLMSPATPYFTYTGDKTPKERIEALGIKARNIDNSNPLMTLLADGLERAKNMGARLPRHITTDEDMMPGAVASYMPILDAVSINKNSDYWDDPWNKASETYEAGFWSSDDPLAPVYHEIGHAHHKKDSSFREKFRADTSGRKKILDIIMGFVPEESKNKVQLYPIEEVSEYAFTNGSEFVAEMYAGLMSGRTYSPHVLDTYKYFGGPELFGGK